MKRAQILAKSALSFFSLATFGSLTGCTLDPLPMDENRVITAQRAYAPIEPQLNRGPASEASFTRKWRFDEGKGFNYDPGLVEIKNARLELKTAHTREPASLTDQIRAREVAIVEVMTGRPFVALRSFAVKTGPEHQGIVQFQLSNDGSHWYFHNGKQWTQAMRSIAESNTSEQVNEKIRAFHQEAGAGRLFVKMYLQAPNGTEKVQLEEVEVTGLSPIQG